MLGGGDFFGDEISVRSDAIWPVTISGGTVTRTTLLALRRARHWTQIIEEIPGRCTSS